MNSLIKKLLFAALWSLIALESVADTISYKELKFQCENLDKGILKYKTNSFEIEFRNSIGKVSSLQGTLKVPLTTPLLDYYTTDFVGDLAADDLANKEFKKAKAAHIEFLKEYIKDNCKDSNTNPKTMGPCIVKASHLKAEVEDKNRMSIGGPGLAKQSAPSKNSSGLGHFTQILANGDVRIIVGNYEMSILDFGTKLKILGKSFPISGKSFRLQVEKDNVKEVP